VRILHLNTFDTTGGAARATYHLHRGLLQLGHDSTLLVAHRRSDEPTVMAFSPPSDWTSRLRRRLRGRQISQNFSRYRNTRPAGYEKFTDDRTPYGSAVARQLPACDVINLHWIADFVDLPGFFSYVPPQIPIFWRLSDMNAFTGGCHYDHGCGKYMTGCGTCPQIGSADPDDLSRQIWQRKQAVFGRLEAGRLHIVALNRWMAENVRHNPLLGKFPVTIVPNGVDTDVFAPRDRRLSRDVLRIPQDRRVVLFAGAEGPINIRKGFALLTRALSELCAVDDLLLVSVGGGATRSRSDERYLHLGHIDNDRLLSMVYSAADLYVIPSLQDNQPNTVLEAMACGTPVVGFGVGGISEMVKPQITGLLAAAGDVAALRSAILELLRSSDKRSAMSAACRCVVMEEYTRELQVRRYADLYRAALEKTRQPCRRAV
jgi:glycosyltransferase involved in cell wall biosynthesis